MCDYVHKKVIRLPFPKEILELCNTEDGYECEKYLRDKLNDLFKDMYGFSIEYTRNKNNNKYIYYIDWCYYYTYGQEEVDFGSSRLLTETELKIIKPYFNKIGCKYSDSDLRRVEYCYHTCWETPDYYAIADINNDDSKILLRKALEDKCIKN